MLDLNPLAWMRGPSGQPSMTLSHWLVMIQGRLHRDSQSSARGEPSSLADCMSSRTEKEQKKSCEQQLQNPWALPLTEKIRR